MFSAQHSEKAFNDTIADCSLASDSPSAERNWFAVFVTPRHEKRVDQHCRVRGIQSFLPLFQVQSNWKDGSRRLLHLPLFPTYIFVKMGGSERISVLQIPGIKFIVGNGRQHLALTDAYIQFLQEGLRQGKIEPHPYLSVGAKVRICSGLMAGMEGVLIRKKNNCRVVLTLDIIMKSVTVEVAIEDIQPLHASCPYLPQVAALA